ncbi:conserved hypothetical protein [metagenome]|uniref:Mycothiol-dependent maleylpyruvate isomerase metal-binding domain-containing protein n=1 Tax=metagenome TaxID=256318 RepID=A0A2P2C919_9ZZZZ
MTSEIDLLHEATQRLVRRVDGLHDAAWSEPSGLPGWSRAHVVAHLTLNGEGLRGALEAVARGEAASMYASQERRDDDIVDLAGRPTTELRERFLASTSAFAHALGALPHELRSQPVERVPGGRVFAAFDALVMRWQEVEIHHVDLDAGYDVGQWPLEFAVRVIGSMSGRGAAGEPFRVAPTDTDRTWSFGDGGPTVTGTAAALAWWLTGRGAGDGLSTHDGTLPRIETW